MLGRLGGLPGVAVVVQRLLPGLFRAGPLQRAAHVRFRILWQCLRLCAHVSAESRLARVDYDLTQKPPPDAEEKVQQEANRLFTESVARMNKETTFLETLTAGIPTES